MKRAAILCDAARFPLRDRVDDWELLSRNMAGACHDALLWLICADDTPCMPTPQFLWPPPKASTSSNHKRGYWAEDLEVLSLGPVDWDVNTERNNPDLNALFDGKPIWLKIGFGGDEHMVHQCGQNPDVGIIGCEPYINGVAMLLGKIRKAGVKNLAVYSGDVRDMFDVLPDASIDRAFLLYPDPWPK